MRARADLARLPEQYRAIERAPQVTRGDLAALVGVRLAPLLQNGRSRAAVVITDLRNNWAAPWIMTVARAGVIEPFANHTFQPRTVVRRIDLAQVVNRLLAKVAETTPGRTNPWQASRMKFSDLSATPSRVSGGVGGGGVGRDDGRREQQLSTVTGGHRSGGDRGDWADRVDDACGDAQGKSVR